MQYKLHFKLFFLTVSWSCVICTLGQLSFDEYLNENYTILVQSDATNIDYFSWWIAESMCADKLDTTLASFHSMSDVNSYDTLAGYYGYAPYSCWIGLYETTGQNTNWTWQDGTPFNFTYWNTNEPNRNNEQCGHITQFNPGYWNDISCEGVASYGPTAHCIICNTPSQRNYTISITISNDNPTDYPIWFRIKGTINMTLNPSIETWTEWFKYDNFSISDETYTFSRIANNVGPPKLLQALIRDEKDGVGITYFGVDDQQYTPSTTVTLRYGYGTQTNGCTFVTIDFTTLTRILNETFRSETATCLYLNDLYTLSPTLSPTFTTKIPTLYPTISSNAPTDVTSPPTDSPTKIPTDTPTIIPTYAPTNAPSDIPTHTPTNNPSPTPTNIPTPSPTNHPSNTPTNTPSDIPTDTPTHSPTNEPTKIPLNLPTNYPTIPSNFPSKNPSDVTIENNPTYTPLTPTDGHGDANGNTNENENPTNTNSEIDDNNGDDNDDTGLKSSNTNGSDDTPIYIVIVAICLVLICCLLGGVYWFYTKHNKSNNKEEKERKQEEIKVENNINNLEVKTINLTSISPSCRNTPVKIQFEGNDSNLDNNQNGTIVTNNNINVNINITPGGPNVNDINLEESDESNDSDSDSSIEAMKQVMNEIAGINNTTNTTNTTNINQTTFVPINGRNSQNGFERMVGNSMIANNLYYDSNDGEGIDDDDQDVLDGITPS